MKPNSSIKRVRTFGTIKFLEVLENHGITTGRRLVKARILMEFLNTQLEALGRPTKPLSPISLGKLIKQAGIEKMYNPVDMNLYYSLNLEEDEIKYLTLPDNDTELT